MSRFAILLVALLVVLAGCSATTDSDTTPTPTVSGTTTDGSATSTPDDTPQSDPTAAGETDATPSHGALAGADAIPGVKNGKVVNSTRLADAFAERISRGHARFAMRIRNGSRGLTLTFVNDTQERLTRISPAGRNGSTIYYVTDGRDAFRNTTSGEIRYGTGQSRIQRTATFTRAFVLIAGISYIQPLEWEVTKAETIGDERYYVLESTAINESVPENVTLFARGLNESTVESVDGSLTVDADGVIRTGHITIDRSAYDINVSFSLRKDGDIQVSQPDWFDESTPTNRSTDSSE